MIGCHETGNFFEEWNEITPQIGIRKFEEQTPLERVSLTQSFLTFIGSSELVRTLWMSEITASKAPDYKPFVLQIFFCEFGE